MTIASATVGHSTLRPSGGSSTISTCHLSDSGPIPCRFFVPDQHRKSLLTANDNAAKGRLARIFSCRSVNFPLPSGAPRLAFGRRQSAGFEFAIEETRRVDRPGQGDVAGGRRAKSHARIVGLVADQNDERGARRLGGFERTRDQGLADALAAE